MRRFVFIALTALAALGAPGCAASPETAQQVAELRELDTEEAAFLRQLNDYRTSNGLPALTATRLLNQVAYDHSLDMGTRNYFSHTNPEGQSPFDRMRAAGYTGGWMAENIAAGNASAAATFEQWRTSSGHNTNMLGSRYRAIGIGRAYVAGSTYRYYWTTVFGDVVDASAITPGADAGAATDAGATSDASTPSDAGAPLDASVPPPDASASSDASTPADPCTTSTTCRACTGRAACGWCDGRCRTGTRSGPSGAACTSTRWTWYSYLCR